MQTQNDLSPFLIRAKRSTYAALEGAPRVPPLLPGSHQLEYAEGSWLYRDIYFGGGFFMGQETVYKEGVPVWGMGYAGGLVDDVNPALETAQVYDFLREALRQVSLERPYRGPHTYQQTDYAYSDIGEGHIANFWGVETITLQQKPVYRLRYHGGFIRE
jgi:hypothetical protein